MEINEKIDEIIQQAKEEGAYIEDMLKSIIKLQVAAETLSRQKIINKDVYDYIYREIKFLSERIEKIEDK